MLLTIHDAHLHPVASIDNDKQATLNYFSDTWTRYLDTGAAQFNFTAVKKALINDTYSKRTYNFLSEKNFISFEYEGEAHLFIVRKVIENEELVKVNCVNLNLELINEYVNAYKAPKAMSFEEYCKVFDLLNFTMLKIGINEVADKKITAEWEGQDTKLARLLSLVNKFGAEIEFKTTLNDDGSIKSFVINVYHENDENHQGVGKVRSKVLRYGRDFRSLTRTVDTTGIYNATRPTGKTEEGEVVTIAGMQALEIKNEKGEIEFFQRGDMLYAPLSMSMFPAAFTSGTMSDQWIRKDFPVESASKEVIRSSALRELKKNCYPAVTYEVDGYLPYNPGDTVEIEDDGFYQTLLLQMRVSEQSMSFTGTGENKTVFANFKAIENKLSSGIQKRLEEMLEEAKPYDIKIASDNGTVFKNNKGKSTIYPTLLKGGKTIPDSEVGWKWKLDEREFPLAPTFTVEAAGITKPLTLTVIAIINGKEVAQKELPFTNVNDGKNGAKGRDGEDGRSLRLFTTQYKYAQKFINQYSTDGYTGDWSVVESTAGLKVGDSVQMRVFNTDKESDSWIVAVASAVLDEYRIKTVSKGLIEKGDIGPQGPKGATGEKGEKGDPGKPADPAPINQLKQDMELAKKDLSAVKSDLLKEKSESAAKIEQVKSDLSGIRTQQTAYEQSNTQNLARITGQLGDKASKAEVKQTADGIREEISKISIGGTNLVRNGAINLGNDSYWGGTTGKWSTNRTHGFYKNGKEPMFVIDTSEPNIAYIQNMVFNKLEKNTTYTLSFVGFMSWNVSNFRVLVGLLSDIDHNWKEALHVYNKRLSATGTQRVIVQFNSGNYDGFSIRFDNMGSSNGQPAHVWISEVKVEKGTIATDWSPAPEDTDEQITAARATFEKTAEGLKTDMTAVKSYVADDGKRREQLEQYTRTETARSTESLRKQVSESYVAKSQHTEDVRGITRRFEELTIGGNNLLAYSNFNIGGYYQNGLKSDANYIYSNLIKLQGAEYYLQVWELRSIEKKNWVGIQYFDETKQPLANGYSTFWFNGYFKQLLQVPAATKYIAISLDKRALNKDEIKFKLETGSIPTDWSPAPEDTETKLAEYKHDVDGQLAAVKQDVNGKVSQTTFDQRTNQITQSVQELNDNVVKKNQIKVNENGIVSTAEKVVNGQTLASMIAQHPEWVEIIAKLLKVKADMIVNGAITADKLNVKELSALASDLGEITAGEIEFTTRFRNSPSHDAWGTVPGEYNYDTTVLINSSGIYSNGKIGRKNEEDKTPTITPVSYFKNGELFFANLEAGHSLKYMQINGIHPFIQGGSSLMYFSKKEDGKDALYITCHNAELYLKSDNYTDWKQSEVNNKVRWKVQGSLVLVDFNLQFDRDGTYHLVDIPKEYVPSNKMFPVQAWSLDRNKDRTAQLNVGGDLHIIGAEKDIPYLGQIIWTY